MANRCADDQTHQFVLALW